MNWQSKAAIMRFASQTPLGDRWYHWVQKKFGRLKAQPMARLPIQTEMLKWLCECGFSIEGKTLFEVGTGHMPIVPIGFFLAGAGEIITVDLNRRIDWTLTRDSLRWMVEHRHELDALYQDVVPSHIFEERFAMLQRWQADPKGFFDKANIHYRAPYDAAQTDLPERSIDLHFSVTTLEHIPYNILTDIFTEAKRILRLDGLAIHFIDPSDHFQHQDKTSILRKTAG
ncbi:methyltransferase domain-containing protein [Candidatus Chloroploca sp. Khr17]|uniref:methyltransferase domain-containing protein n=1 Tax=Candidatus Chloroploca sp. Khr17 TaxID=2496869 RepID=UPI00101C4FE7|nr:methyltransferase domain-containing protein [Candidatus Chloroploca sp. Khr17]